MKFLLFITSTLLCLSVQGQVTKDSSGLYDEGPFMEKSFNQNDEPYVYVQVAAEYIDGGESKFIEYVTSYVKKNAAPQNDSAATVTGVLFVQYVIEKDGSVSTASIMPGEGINPAYDQAAIEAVKKSKWKPASNYGTPVRYKKINRFKFY